MRIATAQEAAQIWVFLIERSLDTGADISLHWHELEASRAARLHMESNWPDNAGPMPADVTSAIEAYNHHHQGLEHLWLTSRPIGTAGPDLGLDLLYDQPRQCGEVWRRDFVRSDLSTSAEWHEVQRISTELIAHMNEPAIYNLLRQANSPGVHSSQVQKVLLDKASTLGFRDESKGLFDHYRTKGIRPDYYMEVGSTGVILEVERGKTTTNNMDFLDFWKCHICRAASFLVLMVPTELQHNEEDKPKFEFQKVSGRLESFFFTENYTNVWGLVLIGY